MRDTTQTVETVFLIILLLTKHIHAWCALRRGNKNEAYWELAHTDKVHARPLLRETVVDYEFDCLSLCLKDNACYSVNYKYDAAPHTCQLSKYNRLNAPVYEDKPGWKHYDTGFKQFVAIKTWGAVSRQTCYRGTSGNCKGYKLSSWANVVYCNIERNLSNKFAYEYDPVLGTLRALCSDSMVCPTKDIDDNGNPNLQISADGTCPVEFDGFQKRFRRTHFGITWSNRCFYPWGDDVTGDSQNLEIGACNRADKTNQFEFYGAIKAPIRVYIWFNLGYQDSISAARNAAPGYSDSPNLIGYADAFVLPQWKQYYLAKMSAMFVAPATGSYTFYVSADNLAELWLKTGANSERIIECGSCWHSSYQEGWHFTLYDYQKSGVISLVEGDKYFMSAVYYQGDGAGWLQVAMKRPDLEGIRIIEMWNLQPLDSEMES